MQLLAMQPQITRDGSSQPQVSRNCSSVSSVAASIADDGISREVRLAKVQNVTYAEPGELGDRHRGISIHNLGTGVIQDIENAGMCRDARIYEIEEKVIRGKAPWAACPRDGKPGLAYVDALLGQDQAGRATHMLSYSWGYTVSNIVGALARFSTLHELNPKRTYIWICCLCINQHRVQEAINAGQMISSVEFGDVFRDRVLAIGAVLALMEPWQAPRYITRVWCLFEFFTASEHASDVELKILMPPQEADNFVASVFEGVGAKQLWDTLSDIRVEAAEASVENNRVSILEEIEQGSGVCHLNSVVRKKMQSWFAEEAESQLVKSLSLATARACGHVANMFVWLGLNSRAQRLLQSGMACLTEGGAGVSSDAAFLIRQWGVVKRMDGDIEGALEKYAEAYQVHHATATLESEDCAMVLMNMGNMQSFLDRLEAAGKSYQESRHIRENLGTLASDKGGLLLTNLGALQGRIGQPKIAIRTLDEAHQIREETRTMRTPDGAFLLDQVGMILDQMGAYNEALESFYAARKVRDMLGNRNSADGALSSASLGLLHCHRGDFQKAVESYEEAKKIREAKDTLDKPEGRQLMKDLAEAQARLAQQQTCSGCCQAGLLHITSDLRSRISNLALAARIRLEVASAEVSLAHGILNRQETCEEFEIQSRSRADSTASLMQLQQRLHGFRKSFGNVFFGD